VGQVEGTAAVIEVLSGPGIVFVAAAMLVMLAVNLAALRVPRSLPAHPDDDLPFVSVLIPARNESECIEGCLRSVLGQSGIDFEVIVLDDCSEDDTYRLAAAIVDPRLTVLAGQPLPDGWTGKNWACHQLAQRASGPLLCFVDADTRLAPEAVRGAVDALTGHRADLVSYLVAAEYRTVAQAVLLPMVNHALLALFPVFVMHSRWFPRIALALGPFLIVRADAYQQVGGHAARRGEVVDDVKLCRAVKASGGRVRLANGARVATTRWYADTRGIWNGFSKNAFGALESSSVLAFVTSVVLVPMLVIPFLRLALGVVDGHVPDMVIVQVVLIALTRVATSLVGRDPLWTVPFHPFATVFWGATLVNSARLAGGDETIEWRGRQVPISGGGTMLQP
jgi:chlorobactene glucosyltransferase